MKILPGVKRIRVNPFVRSVAIEYDPAVLGAEFWEMLERASLPEGRPELRKRLEGLLLFGRVT